MKWVWRSDIKVIKEWPTIPDKIVIIASDEAAEENTSNLGWRIAIKAAIRKVLSPISDTPIMETAMMKDFVGFSTCSGLCTVVAMIVKWSIVTVLVYSVVDKYGTLLPTTFKGEYRGF